MSSVFQTTITKVLGLAESYPGYARLKLQRDFFKDKPLLQHWNQFDIYVKNYFDTVIKNKQYETNPQKIEKETSYSSVKFTDEEKPIEKEFSNSRYIVIHTIGDGSCLLHALFLSLSKYYRALTNENKIKIVDYYRRNEFYNLFKENTTDKFNSLKTERNTVSKSNFRAFLEETHVTSFCSTYRINAIVLSTNLQFGKHYGIINSDDTIGDQQSNYSKFNKNGYPYIFLINHGQGHYSSVYLEKIRKFILTEEELFTYFPILCTNLSIGDNSEKIGRALERGEEPPGELTDADILKELERTPSRLYSLKIRGGKRRTRRCRPKLRTNFHYTPKFNR
uniref:OTU domain-containing protein n=1 Tax=viral metagenome TaxID=1070528 RepID=A0A6C0HF00_9ZZZZ